MGDVIKIAVLVIGVSILNFLMAVAGILILKIIKSDEPIVFTKSGPPKSQPRPIPDTQEEVDEQKALDDDAR